MNSYKNRRSVYWLRTTIVLISLHRLISWLLRRISYYTSALYVIKYHDIKPTIPCPLFSQNYSMADFKKWLNKGHDCIFIFTTCPLFRFVSSFSLFSHAGFLSLLYRLVSTNPAKVIRIEIHGGSELQNVLIVLIDINRNWRCH